MRQADLNNGAPGTYQEKIMNLTKCIVFLLVGFLSLFQMVAVNASNRMELNLINMIPATGDPAKDFKNVVKFQVIPITEDGFDLVSGYDGFGSMYLAPGGHLYNGLFEASKGPHQDCSAGEEHNYVIIEVQGLGGKDNKFPLTCVASTCYSAKCMEPEHPQSSDSIEYKATHDVYNNVTVVITVHKI